MKKGQHAVAGAAALESVLISTSGSGTATSRLPMVVTSAQSGDHPASVRLVLRGKLTGLHPGTVRQIRPSSVNDSAFTITLHRSAR